VGDGKKDLGNDLSHFKDKVEQGASFVITQMFLENKQYFEFVDKAREVGVVVPIIPGIMPIINLDIIKVAKGICGASIPPALERKLEAKKDEPKEIWEIGIEHAIHQCRALMGKVPCIHFYTMDMWKPTKAILDGLK